MCKKCKKKGICFCNVDMKEYKHKQLLMSLDTFRKINDTCKIQNKKDK